MVEVSVLDSPPPLRLGPARVRTVSGEQLSIPLIEPFVIASGRMDVTRAVLVELTMEDLDTGRTAVGLGEAAALPPVTAEDQPQLLSALARAAMGLAGAIVGDLADVDRVLTEAMSGGAVARAGVEAALLDGWARLHDMPLATLLGGGGPRATTLLTDITLPISDPTQMAATARRHAGAGFTCFKVKVGRDWRADSASLQAVAAAVPGARFRLDANAGFAADDALALLDGALGAGLTVECFEQPCAAADLAGMARVTAASPVPVVADESFRGADDLDRLIDARAAHGVNLKLAKLGGPLAAIALGRRARAAGLRLMAGAMVETRVGLLAMAHVVAALGGVDFVDLDTAFLLADDPFAGGWTAVGPELTLTGEPGLGLSKRNLRT